MKKSTAALIVLFVFSLLSQGSVGAQKQGAFVAAASFIKRDLSPPAGGARADEGPYRAFLTALGWPATLRAIHNGADTQRSLAKLGSK